MTTYYREGIDRAKRVQDLFSKIAGHYDLVNDLQSAGMHRLWKKRQINSVDLQPQDSVLDLACGSGDLVFRMLQKDANLRIVGGDYTFSMLRVARSRSSKNQKWPQGWIQLDGLTLPFSNESFHAVTMAYGLRNMADPQQSLNEISRVLKPGGKLAILDFGKPPNPVLRSLYFGFLRTIQPRIGSLFFGDAETYRYLYQSLIKYPAQEGVMRLLANSGFKNISCQNLALGTMSLHLASKS
jgi:demethylmenaquinone methyltransferase / 2-methoxy-6-polyprenyl-1,4-benzoquinol methylase